MKTAVIDYEAGNLRSVETALKYCGIEYFVSEDPDRLKEADKVIFPGVGEARAAMEVLKQKGFDDAVKEHIQGGKPFLGICIGYQILFDRSEERDAECLGLIPGVVRRFPEKDGYKVPHMGWNEVSVRDREDLLFSGIEQNSSFYFVHSFYPDPEDSEHAAGISDYILPFASYYRRENCFAVQFHPEKSGKAGLRLLYNFSEIPG